MGACRPQTPCRAHKVFCRTFSCRKGNALRKVPKVVVIRHHVEGPAGGLGAARPHAPFLGTVGIGIPFRAVALCRVSVTYKT